MRTAKKVALLIEMSNSYGRELLEGIRNWQREHPSWSVRLSESGRGAEVPTWLQKWEGDGVIARVENGRIARALKAIQLPVIDVSAATATPIFPRVASNGPEVSRVAAMHLLERGFRNFAYYGDDRVVWSRLRHEYFHNHLSAAGFSCSKFSPAAGETLYGESELRALAAWLRGLPKPVGVFTSSDIRGQRLLNACQLAQLPVPDEVAVIGVHNDTLLCDFCDPPLSSVIPNARKAGYVAAELLERMMQKKDVPVKIHSIDPLGVAQRQSTDVTAVKDPQLSAVVRYIREHACEGIDVNQVLRAIPMSRTLLEQKFRQSLGQTPHEHILRVRLDRVKLILATTDLPVREIAELTGFEHNEYLSVAFKRSFGKTATEYRAQSRASSSGKSK